MIAHDNTTTFTQPTANASGASIPEDQLPHGNNRGGVTPSKQEISIVEGATNPSNDDFYDPSPATLKRGSSVTWINNDSLPHTATSDNPQNGEAPTGAIFDSGIIGPGQASKGITINADAGAYDYYCTLHPYMRGQLTIEE
jgi:plastocyanin